jgi:hypothetical protein
MWHVCLCVLSLDANFPVDYHDLRNLEHLSWTSPLADETQQK